MTPELQARVGSYRLVLEHLERAGGSDRGDWIAAATGANSKLLHVMREQGLVMKDARSRPARWVPAPQWRAVLESLASALADGESGARD